MFDIALPKLWLRMSLRGKYLIRKFCWNILNQLDGEKQKMELSIQLLSLDAFQSFRAIKWFRM